MPEVTRLSEKRGRVRVEVDGEFYAEIDPAVAEERGLVEGFDIPDAELLEICHDGERALAMRRAFNLLAYRSRSKGEVRNRLVTKHGHSDGVVESVLERLAELGYLDDHEFARSVAHQKAEKYGPRRISSDLEKAGIDRSIVQKVVEEEFSDRDELREASEAACERYNREGAGGESLVRKVYGFLVRRGYSPGVCAEVANRYRTGDREVEL